MTDLHASAFSQHADQRPAGTSRAGTMPAGTGWPAGLGSPEPAHALPTSEPAGPARPAAQAVPAQRAAARRTPGRDRSGAWLRYAALGLSVLAGASAAVSFSAQYQMVLAARRLPVVAGLEAAIPDAAALVFACLGVAMALHGRRAVRARCLNVAAVGTSVLMNAIAAAPGWRGLVIWAMPPVAYALASDTLIGVVRTHAIARHRDRLGPLTADEATPLAAMAGLVLWLLRLAVAPVSTLAGFRAWVIAECPAAPRRRAARPAPVTASRPPRAAARPARRGTRGRGATKTARFLDLVIRRHGPLDRIPLASVARICADLAPHVDLDPGAARTALRRAVLAATSSAKRSLL